MNDLKARYIKQLGKVAGTAKYDQIYGKLLHSGTAFSDYPHPDGRAVDFMWKMCLKAMSHLMHLNDLYLSGVTKIIGYTPSSLIVVEDNNCFHMQIPRNIPEDREEGFISFIEDVCTKASAV